MFERSLDKAGVRIFRQKFMSQKSLFQCARLGLGPTICPISVVKPELDTGELVQLPWAGFQEEAALLMIWHTEKWCPPALERFMLMMEETAAGFTSVERAKGV